MPCKRETDESSEWFESRVRRVHYRRQRIDRRAAADELAARGAHVDLRAMTEVDILDRLTAAHGGRDAWSDVTAISARLSTGGLAYKSRLRFGALRHIEVAVHLVEQRVSVLDFPWQGWWGEWCHDRVSLGPVGGVAEQRRAHARGRFKGWLAHPRWDDLDLLFFLGYALWNYLSFPRLLALPGVVLRLLHGGRHRQPTLLAARFPDDIPTHCEHQYFHLDADGLLRRHDYVAEVFGRWAAGANHCLRNEMVDGLRLYTRRRVVPAMGHRVSLPVPTLVWIELDDLSVIREPQAPAIKARWTSVAPPPDSPPTSFGHRRIQPSAHDTPTKATA